MLRFGRWVWIGSGLLLAYVAVYSVLVAFPQYDMHITLLDLMSVGTAMAAAALCVLAAFRARDQFMRWYWGFFALANACSMIAEALWAVYELVLVIEAPYPSFADMAWLAYYPLAFVGILRLVRTGSGRRIAETIPSLDAVLVSLAGILIAWQFLIAPVIDPEAGSLTNITSIAYPLGDLLLLGALVSLALSVTRRAIPRGTAWVVASILAMVFADLVYTRMTIAGTYATGSWVDPLWPLSYAFFGIGALVYCDSRAKGRIVERPVRSSLAAKGSQTAAIARRGAPFAAVLTAGTICYVHFIVQDGGSPLNDGVVVVLTFLIPIVVLTRQLLVGIENGRLQSALVEASRSLEVRVSERTQELAAEKERLNVLNRAAEAISRSESIQEVMVAGLQSIARATHCPSVAISAAGQRGSLRFLATDEVPAAGREQLRRMLRGFVLANADHSDNTPFLLTNPHSRAGQTGEGGETAGQPLKAMVFPVVSRQVMLGAACLASDRAECRLSEGESELVVNIVSQLAVALESVCRYDDARYLADNDALTGLANRRSIGERLDQELARSERTGESFSLLLMDVNNFKFFNDTYGHATGDHVLASVANALHEAVRGGDTVGRFGGDEFVALLPATDETGAAHVVERIDKSLAARSVMAADAAPLSLRVSCGIAVYPQDGRRSEELLRVADARMYREKREVAARSTSAA